MSYSLSIAADLHCHTVASDHAYSTVTELAQAAAARGLLAIGCTDHGVGISDSPHIWHFENLHILPDHIAGVRVLQGVEANVMDYTGALDMPDSVLDRLQVVIASMHRGVLREGTEEEATAAWLAIAENPRVDMIGHSGTPAYRYDYERVIPVFGKTGKIVEINENTFGARSSSAENCRTIAALCKKYRVRVMINSDAHYHEQVGRFPRCLQMLEELDFPPELVVNGSRENFERFLSEKGLSL